MQRIVLLVAAIAFVAAAPAAAQQNRDWREAHLFLGQKRILGGEIEAAALRRALALCPRRMVEHHATRVELGRLGIAAP